MEGDINDMSSLKDNPSDESIDLDDDTQINFSVLDVQKAKQINHEARHKLEIYLEQKKLENELKDILDFDYD